MCYVSIDLYQRALQTNGKLFSNFEFVFEILTDNRNILKRKAKSEYRSNCNALYINEFDSTNSKKVNEFDF